MNDTWETVPRRSRRPGGRGRRNNNNNNRHHPTRSGGVEPAGDPFALFPDLRNYHNRNTTTPQPQQCLILLCGLPGSGKSTVARLLQAANDAQFVRVNQDDLGGNRKRVEARVRQVLAAGQSPLVDRCNFDAAQRHHFVQLVREMENVHETATATDTTTNNDALATNNNNNNNNATTTTTARIPIDCIVLEPPLAVCQARCRSRRHHPTLPPSKADGVIADMARQWVRPDAAKEGLRNIWVVRNTTTTELRRVIDYYLPVATDHEEEESSSSSVDAAAG